MKRVLALLLIYATISVMFGQDLNYQLDSLKEQYGINIKDSIKDKINDIFGYEIIVEDTEEK